jgi:hypothetical protein
MPCTRIVSRREDGRDLLSVCHREFDATPQHVRPWHFLLSYLRCLAMSVLADKDGLPARPPGERTDTDTPSGVDPVHLHGPLGDRVQESEPDTTSFGPQFKEALHDFMKTWRAPEPRELGSRDEKAEPSAPDALPVWIQLMNAIAHFTKAWVAPAEPVRVAPAPTTKDVLAAAPFDAVATEAEEPSGVDLALAHGPLAAGSSGVQEIGADTTSLGSRLLHAIEHSKTTLLAPEEPVVAAPAPPTREVLPVSPPRRVEVISVLGPAPMTGVLPASPRDLASVLASLARATTAEEAVATATMFSEGLEPMLKAASDPAAALGAIFGNDIVATVTEVCAAAVVDLEAEAAATGEPVTDQAATRIARSMVDRVIQRAGRTMALAPRVCRVPRVRTQRAPRAHRAPRSAVRLSAVASAGDGPPPPPSAHAPLCAWAGSQFDRLHVGHWLVAQRDDVEEHLGDLRKRDLTAAPRTLLRVVVRPYARSLWASLREASVVRRDVLAESCQLATRPKPCPDRVQRLRPAHDATDRAGLAFRELRQANHARHDDQKANDAGPSDDPRWLAMTRSGRRRCGVERACLATERGRGGRHDRAAVALVSLALARDALREAMRVGGDADPWGLYFRWLRAPRRPASTPNSHPRRTSPRALESWCVKYAPWGRATSAAKNKITPPGCANWTVTGFYADAHHEGLVACTDKRISTLVACTDKHNRTAVTYPSAATWQVWMTMLAHIGGPANDARSGVN